MKKILILIFFLIFAAKEASASTASITSLSIDPQNPSVFKAMTITLEATNYANTDTFVIEVFVIRDGIIKTQLSYSVTLQSTQPLKLSPTFTPDDIGNYEIVVKLWDKTESVLFDSKLLQFTVISDIGPFDLSINVLTRTVVPGDDIPLTIQMINQGEKSEDVKLRTTVYCNTQGTISIEYFLYLLAKSTSDRVTTIPSCLGEYGLRTVSADLIVFNRTLLTSTNQIFLNTSTFNMTVEDFPPSIDVTTERPNVVDLFVENNANQSIHNLQVVFDKIPFSWYQVTPPFRSEVKPGEIAVFLINFTVPYNDINQSGDFPTSLIAAALESAQIIDSNLRITRAGGGGFGLPSFPFSFPSFPSIGFDPIIIGVIIAVVAALGFLAVRKRRKTGQYEELKEKWHRIRRTIGE